jgi:hypothetical protein
LGAFDPLGFEGRAEVVFAKGGGVAELELLLEPGAGFLTGTDGKEEAFYSVAYWDAYLVGSDGPI